MITLNIAFPDGNREEVQIDPNCKTLELIEAIQAKYKQPKGVLFSTINKQPLPFFKNISEQAVVNDDTLIYRAEQEDYPVQLFQRVAALNVQRTAFTYDLRVFPALIGRSEKNVSTLRLPVNLHKLESSQYVSREHAEIYQENGRFFIRRLAQQNPVTINHHSLCYNETYNLINHDCIRLDHSGITLKFNMEEMRKHIPVLPEVVLVETEKL